MTKTKTLSGKTGLTKISNKEISMSRVFEATPAQLYKVFTDPTAISKWWGPAYLTTRVEIMDVRPGGKWRFIQTSPDGKEFAFSGKYLEIVPNVRTVSTFEFEAMPGHVVTETVTFEEFNGKTRVTTLSLFQSPEDLEGMLQSGMESGASESWDRLEELLETIN
jgi:uncharacterized protein YndB with AHSA1/START domain